MLIFCGVCERTFVALREYLLTSTTSIKKLITWCKKLLHLSLIGCHFIQGCLINIWSSRKELFTYGLYEHLRFIFVIWLQVSYAITMYATFISSVASKPICMSSNNPNLMPPFLRSLLGSLLMVLDFPMFV